MSYIASWSGGKDSCFAYYKAILGGYDISHIVNFISDEYKRVRFHGSEAKIIQLQAKAIDIDLLQKETTASQSFEKDLQQTINTIAKSRSNCMRIFVDC